MKNSALLSLKLYLLWVKQHESCWAVRSVPLLSSAKLHGPWRVCSGICREDYLFLYLRNISGPWSLLCICSIFCILRMPLGLQKEALTSRWKETSMEYMWLLPRRSHIPFLWAPVELNKGHLMKQLSCIFTASCSCQNMQICVCVASCKYTLKGRKEKWPTRGQVLCRSAQVFYPTRKWWGSRRSSHFMKKTQMPR